MSQIERRQWLRPLLGAVLVGVMVLAAGGCARTRPRLPQWYEAGVTVSFKRVEQFPQRDFVHHFFRRAYHKPYSDFAPFGPDQAATVMAWGRPDWIRKSFRSLQNELVAEWVYLDKGRIFQFIGPELVFEGPLTDYEQILLMRGYPDRMEVYINENGSREDLFIYHKVFTAWLEQFKLRDGEVVQAQEGN